MSPRTQHSGLGRRTVIIVVLALLVIPFGVPRFLAGGDTSASVARTQARFFTKLCRDHGGTPATRTLTVTGSTTPQQVCTVRYGGQVYVMDAITRKGFDDDTAHYQRQGCELARQEQAGVPRGKRVRFVYHPDTGVCEHGA